MQGMRAGIEMAVLPEVSLALHVEGPGAVAAVINPFLARLPA